ncbi:AMP-binding protein [Streptomyces sp. Y7]|uniref:AMP-binding protein n=1 Tax=Streptomyces sp. Y7 TaxID=3342392 RepID=UPI0037178617
MLHRKGLVSLVGYPELFLADVDEYQVSRLNDSPAMYRALLAAPSAAGRRLESLSLATSDRADRSRDRAADPETVRRLAGLSPNARITEGYGLTEATMALALHPVDGDVEFPPGSVGIALPDTELSPPRLDRPRARAAGRRDR